MYATIKDTILRKIEELGWSLEELDFRLNLPEGSIADFISSDAQQPTELIMGRLTAFFKMIGEKNILNTIYVDHLLFRLSNETVYGHIEWDKCNEKTIIFENEDSERCIKRLTVVNSNKERVIDSLSVTVTAIAGPLYHYRTRNSLDVYIVKTSDVTCVPPMRKFMQNIYVTDKHGYVVAWKEVGTNDKGNAMFHSCFNMLYHKVIRDNSEPDFAPLLLN